MFLNHWPLARPSMNLTSRLRSSAPSSMACRSGYVRSEGHDYEGLSYTASVPFIILDMFNLRSVDIDMYRDTAWLKLAQPSVKFTTTSPTKAKPSHFLPASAVLLAPEDVSVEEDGNLMRKYGLSVDNFLDAKLVDVSVKILDRSTMGEDLFWAIRGDGGESFSIILAWKIKLVPVPETVTVFRVNKTLEQGATDVLYKWQLVTSKLPKELFVRAMPQVTNGTVTVFFICQFLGDANKLFKIQYYGM